MLLIVLALAGQQVGAQPAAVQPEVVITGKRMRDALEKCLARNCPPEEEVDAAMNAGAESFSAGRYEEAKAILRRAISRNRKYAARMPGPISDLYATFADVTEHEGDEGAFRHATRESVYVLREALGRDHAQVLSVSARLGDMWVKLGDPISADREYRGAAEEAERSGKPDIAAGLTFRRAWLALNARDLERSRTLLEQLERSHRADSRFAGALRVLRARIDIAKGNEGGTDELVAALRGAGGAAPVLLYEPRYPVLHAELISANKASPMTNILLLRSDIRWADIGYWIRPDGKPAEVEILRPAENGAWAKLLVDHIKARRYAPATQNAGDPGTYRVERFTLRPSYSIPTGSHIWQRRGVPTLHMVDLTQLAQSDVGPPQP